MSLTLTKLFLFSRQAIGAALIVLTASAGAGPSSTIDLLDNSHNQSLFTETEASTSVRWVGDSESRMVCEFFTSEPGYRCGLDVSTMGAAWDLSKYTLLTLQLEYSGPAEKLRIYFSNMLTSADQLKHGKRSQVVFPLKEGLNNLQIPLDQFHPPNWWLEQYGDKFTEEELSYRGHATNIGFDVNTPMDIGRHEFTLINFYIEATGQAQERSLTLPIVYVVIVLLGLAIFYRRSIFLKRSKPITNEELLFSCVSKRLGGDQDDYRGEMQDQLTGLLLPETLKTAIDHCQYECSDAPRGNVSMIAIRLESLDDNVFKSALFIDYIQRLCINVKINIANKDLAFRWDENVIVILTSKHASKVIEKSVKKLQRAISDVHMNDLQEAVEVKIGWAPIDEQISISSITAALNRI